MTSTVYLVGALLSWPILVVSLAVKCNGLRRGPSLSTVAMVAAVAAVLWPLALALVYVLPTAGRPR